MVNTVGRRAVKGAIATAAVYSLSQILRLASNLVMTRLLSPEHFGIIAIVNVFIIGINMFSDIGLGPNIIQSKSGNDKQFLDTAFTLQFLRGLVLATICLACAWPMATFYGEAQLVQIIPACGLGLVISGLNSTKVFTAYRNLQYVRVSALEIISQIATILAMLAVAINYPSVWVLVFGSVFNACIKMVLGHVMLEGSSNNFRWNWTEIKSTAHFAKWVFLSTLVGFASNSSASLLLAKFVTIQELGVFTVVVTLAKAFEQLYDQIANKVLMPLYAHYHQTDPVLLNTKTRSVKMMLQASFLPLLCIAVVFGEQIISMVFDKRYQGGGWIFQFYCFCMIPTIVSGIGPFYLALGNSKLMMQMSVLRLVLFAGCAMLGWSIGGASGLIAGMAAFTFPYYLAELVVQWKYRIWQPKLDSIAFALSIAVIAIGLKFVRI